MPEIHEQRQAAEGFGAGAAAYDRARPSYPAALFARIAASSPGPDVLDVGCGTGITSRLLTAAGLTVLGVEPDERMAALAREGGLEVEIARFEEWDPAGRLFDAVTAGQAWHWVDPAGGAAAAARALRPGGRIVLFWNAFAPPDSVRAAFGEVTRRVLAGSPGAGTWDRPALGGYRGMCATAAAGLAGTGRFGEPGEWLYGWELPYTTEAWLDFLPTAGGFGLLPAEKREELLAGHAAAVDAAGGSFVMHYDTVAVTAVRADRSAG